MKLLSLPEVKTTDVLYGGDKYVDRYSLSWKGLLPSIVKTTEKIHAPTLRFPGCSVLGSILIDFEDRSPEERWYEHMQRFYWSKIEKVALDFAGKSYIFYGVLPMNTNVSHPDSRYVWECTVDHYKER